MPIAFQSDISLSLYIYKPETRCYIDRPYTLKTAAVVSAFARLVLLGMHL